MALSEDFVQAAQELSENKADHAMVANSGEQILTYGEASFVPESERDNFDLLVSHHFARRIFDPPMGTVESILGTGRIDLLRSQELVAELTQWSSTVAGLTTLEIEARSHFYERVYPYLSSRVDLEDLDKGFAQFVDFPWEQEPVDAYTLLSDQEFLNVVYMHWVLKMNILDSLDNVESSLVRIRELTEEQLSE